jgi:cephalosporin-C deacetylase
MQHDYPFDPTYGYRLEQLLEVASPEEPADFADFWRSTYRESRETPLNFKLSGIASPDEGFELFEVEYDSLGGLRIGGWLALPANGEVSCGAVIGHGYGGRERPEFQIPLKNAALIWPCARGFHRSTSERVPNSAAWHVLHGIESRETYSHRGSVADYWAAASVLLEICPAIGENLFYLGASFGGGIGAMLLPWDSRFKKAYLDVPSFGNHPLRVTLPCAGSGASVRSYHRRNPDVLQVLQYFDSSLAAGHIRMPVYVAAALFDPAVPPPGQFAVYNALPEEKRLFVRRAAHFDCPEQREDDNRIFQELSEWFAR